MKLYQWQKEAVARFARAAYFALAVDCGLGKTAAAIRIALAKKRPVLIIAPGKTLCEQWKREIAAVAGPDEEIWTHSRTEETRRGDAYRNAFSLWLSGGEDRAAQRGEGRA